MDDLNRVLTEMNFDFFGSGEHAMSVEGMRKVLDNDHFLFLDVRTEEEVESCAFPFARHIPLHRLPERMDELPRDKCIVAFCSSIFRGAIAYTYLRTHGFAEVKGLTAPVENLLAILKPGPLYQR